MTDTEKRALMALSAALAFRQEAELRRAMEECLSAADPARAEEVILQSDFSRLLPKIPFMALQNMK